MVFKRTGINSSREIRHLMAGESAAEAVGDLYPDCEIYGLTSGQFDLISIIEHCLDQIGPCRISIATWTAAGADLEYVWRLLDGGGFERVRFLVDASFYSRKPEWCRELIDVFGPDCIRATTSHAKFVTMVNDKWHLAIRTSMNLNRNKRMENFEISDDRKLTDYLEDVVENEFKRPLDFSQGSRAVASGRGEIRRIEL